MSTTPGSARTFTRPLRASLSMLIIATIGLVVPGFSPLISSRADAEGGTGNLELVGQTNWVGQGQSFDIQVKPTTDLVPDQAELVLTAYGSVRTRSQFRQSLEDKMSGPSIILDRHSLPEVLQPDGTARVTMPVQDPAQKRFFLRNAGVYPLRVELRNTDTGDVLDRFVTHILNEPQPATTRLGVTTILPVQSPRSNDEEQPLLISDQGASVRTVAQALLEHPDNPVTLVPQPETLDRLRRTENDPTKSVIASLANAQASRPVLRTSWAPLNAPAYDEDLSGEVDRQFQAGETTLRTSFPDIQTNTWAGTDTLDASVLSTLKRRGVDRIIAREQDISSPRLSTTLARPFVLSNGRGKETFQAAQADQGLANHFADPEGPTVGAHRLLADLAVLWNDSPNLQRNVVVMPPRNWTPDATFLNTVLAGTQNSPLVTPTNLDTLFSTPVQGGNRTPLTQRLNPLPKSEYPVSEINEQRRRLQALASIAENQNPAVTDLGQRLLLAQHADLGARGHRDRVEQVKNEIDEQLGGIRLPKERSIRLTAREGEIPVTVQNDNGYPVYVKVKLSAGKLSFPAGNERTIEAVRQYSTERFAVDARTSGAFGVQVQLESPDGSLVLQKSEITVRSTATSRVGLGLSIGAIVFLAVWWVRSIVNARRKATRS